MARSQAVRRACQCRQIRPSRKEVAICCRSLKRGAGSFATKSGSPARKEHHPEGRYFLEWYQGGKRRRHSVGGFENVIDGARRKAIELGAIRAGLIRPQEEPPRDNEGRISIAVAIDSYLDLVRHHRSLRTYRTYRYTLDTLLRESYTKGTSIRWSAKTS